MPQARQFHVIQEHNNKIEKLQRQGSSSTTIEEYFKSMPLVHQAQNKH
jgi:hypothetical protein